MAALSAVLLIFSFVSEDFGVYSLRCTFGVSDRSPLLALAFVLRIHFTLFNGLRSPLVGDLPDAELPVFARGEEHVLLFVVVHHSHLVRERCLE